MNTQTFNHNNTFYKTFSGTDALVFVIFPQTKPILLGSLTTISYSIFREKRPVPLLGKINTGGYTRGMRTIAGTMIFTVINQHFVEDVIEQVPYLSAHGKFKADELPFFDVMIICANEYGANAQLMIYGAEFLDDAQVISINDMFIENTFGFVARDIDILSAKKTTTGSSTWSYGDSISTLNSANNTTYTAEVVMPYDFNISGYKDFMKKTLQSTSDDTMYRIQNRLKELGYDVNISGVFDNKTHDSILKFQNANDIQETGVLNEITLSLLLDDSFNRDIVTIDNKNGAIVYSDINKSNIIGISKYSENHVGNFTLDMFKTKFNNKLGFISKDDLKSNTKDYLYKDYKNNGYVEKINIKNFNPTDIGTTIKSKKDARIKLSAISYYDNGATKIFSKDLNISKDDTIKCDLSIFKNSYIYSIEEKSMPSKIEFIVSPTGDLSRKWIVEIQK